MRNWIRNRSGKTILLAALAGTAAMILIIVGILHAGEAGRVQKKVNAWLAGDISDLTGKETADADVPQEYLASMELLRTQYADFLEPSDQAESRPLLAAVLQQTRIDVSLPVLVSYPLETEMTVSGPDMVQLLENLNFTSAPDAETLRNTVLQALETGSSPVRTVRVPVTLTETESGITAEPSEAAAAALYGGLSERYAQVCESMLAGIDQALEGQVNGNE